MTEFKYVGKHLDDLHDGRVLVPGQTVELDQADVDHPHNAERIADGLLISVQTEIGVDATDEAKQLAAERDVDLHEVTGSGAGGRVLKGDVETYIQQKEGND